MSQHDLSIANQGFPAFRSDLNDALQALGTNNSGATAPSTTYANMLWYDTANNILKIRNEDNDAWISLITLDQTGDAIASMSIPAVSGSVNFDSNTLVIDASNNRVGVGVASPLRPIDVLQKTSDTDPVILLRGHTTGSDGSRTVAISCVSSDANNWANIQTNAHQFIWTYQGGTERMRIDSTGNLVIANGGISLATNQGPYWGGGTAYISYNTTDNYMSFGTNSAADRMRIDSSGNLIVGGTDANTGIACLTFDGSAKYGLILNNTSSIGTGQFVARFKQNGNFVGSIQTTSSATAYVTSSDYRLKENIAPMTGALAKVALLKPVTYTWKVDGREAQGFIAHELQEVVPDCVTGEKDAVDAEGNPMYQGIDTSFLVATLTAAIQELKAEVDSLKAQLNA